MTDLTPSLIVQIVGFLVMIVGYVVKSFVSNSKSDKQFSELTRKVGIHIEKVDSLYLDLKENYVKRVELDKSGEVVERNRIEVKQDLENHKNHVSEMYAKRRDVESMVKAQVGEIMSSRIYKGDHNG